MSEVNGWIKIHRQLADWEWYDDANTFRVFIHLLLMAQHEPEKSYKGHKILRGQVVTGYDALARELKLSRAKIRTAFKHLLDTNEISQKITPKFSIVTISNYCKFQGKDSDDRKQIASKSQANSKQMTASKEGKKGRKKEEIQNNLLGEDDQKEQNPYLVVPEEFAEYANSWYEFIEYRKELTGRPYKNAKTELSALKKNIKLAENNPVLFGLMVDKAIGREWMGLQALFDSEKKSALASVSGNTYHTNRYSQRVYYSSQDRAWLQEDGTMGAAPDGYDEKTGEKTGG